VAAGASHTTVVGASGVSCDTLLDQHGAVGFHVSEETFLVLEHFCVDWSEEMESRVLIDVSAVSIEPVFLIFVGVVVRVCDMVYIGVRKGVTCTGHLRSVVGPDDVLLKGGVGKRHGCIPGSSDVDG
jgi:hypothetical protein